MDPGFRRDTQDDAFFSNLLARGLCPYTPAMEPTWHDGLSRVALVQLVEGLLTAIDRTVPKLDAVAHHLGLLSQQAEEFEVVGGVADQVADMSDELYAASDRERLREWGNAIDTPDKAH